MPFVSLYFLTLVSLSFLVFPFPLPLFYPYLTFLSHTIPLQSTESRPAELLQLTVQALNSLQDQLSRGPLFLLKEANVNTSWIRILGRLFA